MSKQTLIQHWVNATPVEMMPGATRRTMAYTDDLMMVEIRLEKGTKLPVHDHPHRQVGYVVRGTLDVIVARKTTRTHAQDSYAVDGGVPHTVHAIEDCVLVEVFTPIRDEFV